MKILHVIQTLSPAHGGPSFQLAELCSNLQRKGWQHTVVTWSSADDKRFVQQIVAAGGRVIELSGTRFRTPISASLLRALPRLAAEHDVIHLWAYWGFHNLVYRMFCMRNQRPYIISALSMLPVILRSRIKKHVFNAVVGKAILLNARIAVAISEDEARLYRDRGVAENRIAVVPLAVPDEFLRQATAVVRGSREEIHLLFLGRLHEKKGVQYVLPVMARLAPDFPRLRMLVVGPDGGYRRELEQQVKDLGLESVVSFRDAVYGLSKIQCMALADIFVLPSVLEQIGHAILEGAAAGLPCVYTRACAFPELARAGGGIETDGSRNQLYEAIRLLASDGELRARMGEQARRCIATDYVWSRVTSKYADLYERAACPSTLQDRLQHNT